MYLDDIQPDYILLYAYSGWCVCLYLRCTDDIS